MSENIQKLHHEYKVTTNYLSDLNALLTSHLELIEEFKEAQLKKGRELIKPKVEVLYYGDDFIQNRVTIVTIFQIK